jgi:hypothetical protein
MLREVRAHTLMPKSSFTAIQVLATRVECKRMMAAAKKAGMTQLSGAKRFVVWC